VDNLRYRNCLPLARVVAKTHLQGSDQKTMEELLHQHLAIAGVKGIFSTMRRSPPSNRTPTDCSSANHLSCGALVGAARSE